MNIVDRNAALPVFCLSPARYSCELFSSSYFDGMNGSVSEAIID